MAAGDTDSEPATHDAATERIESLERDKTVIFNALSAKIESGGKALKKVSELDAEVIELKVLAKEALAEENEQTERGSPGARVG